MTTAGPAAPERRVECRRRCVPNSAAWTRLPRRARPPAGHRRRRGPSLPGGMVLARSQRPLDAVAEGGAQDADPLGLLDVADEAVLVLQLVVGARQRDGVALLDAGPDKRQRQAEGDANGKTLETTCLVVGGFDIVAVNLFEFGQQWRFAFAKNSDLPRSKSPKYTLEQRKYLLGTGVKVTWPLEAPFRDEPLPALWASLRRMSQAHCRIPHATGLCRRFSFWIHKGPFVRIGHRRLFPGRRVCARRSARGAPAQNYLMPVMESSAR